MRRAAILICLVLAACGPRFDRPAFLNSLVGAPEVEVIRVLGVPSRTYQTDGHKFLSYIEQRADYIPGGAFFGGYGGGFYGPRFGYGYGGGFPPSLIQRECETTIDVVNGRMATWSLRGNACG